MSRLLQPLESVGTKMSNIFFFVFSIGTNECLEENGGCDHNCINMIDGSYNCSCYDGYILSDDEYTCDGNRNIHNLQ